MPDRPMQMQGAAVITRRHFLRLASISAAGWMTGCAANPVTGRAQLMLLSEASEIQIDRQNSPHQFSSDYGTLQDRELNGYLQQTGSRLAAISHRPHMPYSFRGVNATYVNAYAFPGGSIAATRGILLTLDSEAELAALLGHELGHVNARHTAQQMSKGVLTQAIIGGLSGYAGTQNAMLGDLASSLGAIGAGALLASYSRDNEREADALGMRYMVQAGYSSNGFVGLMDMLNNLSKRKASTTELLFSTHPMGAERYQTAVESARTEYRHARNKPLYRERYMDHTAGLRAIRKAIEEMQQGEKKMAEKKYPEAEAHFKAALKQAPDDYAGLMMMSKCQLAQKKAAEAGRYAEKAKAVYPEEAQAHILAGSAKLQEKKFESAFKDFARYDRLLPGNPEVQFLQGYAQEGLRQFKPAAQHYYRYLQAVNQGGQAQHAYKRMVEWGYVKR